LLEYLACGVTTGDAAGISQKMTPAESADPITTPAMSAYYEY
jgi:hypothetical protein